MQQINVTEPFLPPLDEYIEYLRGIWDRNWLTNQGPLVLELEQKLQAYHQLQMPVHCVANGSLGLQIILKALGVKGEVITTPFSYIATTACPLWGGCTIKFADIEPSTLTIDPKAIETAITPQTEAIIATHVFGNPCDVEALDAIATKHGLAVIYDAAHAFGVRYKGKSILEYGDASMVSLHATKLFHSIEGGFIVAKDSVISDKLEWMRRFGHKGLDDFYGVGVNAKLSEFHAAMGLCNLRHVEVILGQRKAISEAYDLGLQGSASRSGASVTLNWRRGSTKSYGYYPVLFSQEEFLMASVEKLGEQAIYPRRYFYPSLNTVQKVVGQVDECPISDDVTRRILCLPLSAQMDVSVADRVTNLIKQSAISI